MRTRTARRETDENYRTRGRGRSTEARQRATRQRRGRWRLFTHFSQVKERFVLSAVASSVAPASRTSWFLRLRDERHMSKWVSFQTTA